MKCQTHTVKDKTYIITWDGSIPTIDVLQVVDNKPIKRTYHGFDSMIQEEYFDLLIARSVRFKPSVDNTKVK